MNEFVVSVGKPGDEEKPDVALARLAAEELASAEVTRLGALVNVASTEERYQRACHAAADLGYEPPPMPPLSGTKRPG
jgi:hypothetical protein